MDKLSNLTSTIYSIALIAGGIMGFIKAHSKWSLIMGIISGALILISNKIGSKDPRAAYLYIATVSLILSIFFAVRFANTHTFMPNGLMIILSVTTYVVVARSWLKSK